MHAGNVQQRNRRPTDETSSTAARRALLGDTFVINGNNNAETYRIYTLAAWDAVADNNLSQLRRQDA